MEYEDNISENDKLKLQMILKKLEYISDSLKISLISNINDSIEEIERAYTGANADLYMMKEEEFARKIRKDIQNIDDIYYILREYIKRKED